MNFMKHIKLFENIAYNSMLKTIKDYGDIILEMKPYVVYKYNQLAKDPNYYPDWGATPTNEYTEDNVTIINIEVLRNNNLDFTLVDYDEEGVISQQYYVELNENEIEEIKIKMEGDKYNL